MEDVSNSVPSLYLLLVLAGVLFGVGYAYLTWYLNRRGYSEGYVAFLVAGGVGFTLLLSGFVIGWTAAAFVLGLFAATGIPMMAADVLRHVKARARIMER
jgi:hypothetical protein